QEAESVLAYLHEREMGLYVYRARTLPVSIGDRVVRMRGYVADHTHPHYAGKLGLARMAEIVARSAGARGPNVEYLENTVRHLGELGIDDGPLHRVLALVRARGPTHLAGC
ncbi:MAG: gamma-glutamylcyclotransferase, partial [Alphaproteobacteria bacterium]